MDNLPPPPLLAAMRGDLNLAARLIDRVGLGYAFIPAESEQDVWISSRLAEELNSLLPTERKAETKNWTLRPTPASRVARHSHRTADQRLVFYLTQEPTIEINLECETTALLSSEGKNLGTLVFGLTTSAIADERASAVLQNVDYRELIERLPLMAWICSPSGECSYLSPQWIEYTGIRGEDQLGYGWLEQLHPDDREETARLWASATELGTEFDSVYRIRSAAGEHRWFITSAVPILDSKGRILRWLGKSVSVDNLQLQQEKLRFCQCRLGEACAGPSRRRQVGKSETGSRSKSGSSRELEPRLWPRKTEVVAGALSHHGPCAGQ